MTPLALIPIALLFLGVLSVIPTCGLLIYDIWCDLCFPLPTATRAARLAAMLGAVTLTLFLIGVDLWLATLIIHP